MLKITIKNKAVFTWIWITVILIIILGTGAFTFSVVSDKGMPTWDYRPVNSLPSASPDAEYLKLPFPQHIKGKGGK